VGREATDSVARDAVNDCARSPMTSAIEFMFWNMRVCCQYRYPTMPASTRTMDASIAIAA